MANHSDDCPHCNLDRRSYGDPCCAKRRAEITDLRMEHRLAMAARRKTLETLGITPRDRQHMFAGYDPNIVPDEKDLWRFLDECVAARKAFLA